MNNGADSYRRFLEGDESAFDEIVDSQFYPLVYFINGFLHDPFAAEDVAIDAISDLLVNKKRYNFKVSLQTYLFMIGKSKALNYLKRQKRQATVSFSDTESAAVEEQRLEDRIFDNERKRAVLCAIKQLPGDQRTAIHLIFFEELSYEETAIIMNKSKKQVYNLVFRAKAGLRAILEKEGVSIL